jgi:DNA-binding transcriptional ArsR family regulator
VPEWLSNASATDPEPFERVTAFWGQHGLDTLDDGDTYVEWGELLVYAWHARVLFAQDILTALDAIEEQLSRDLPQVELASEPANMVAFIERRMAYLRGNTGAAADYMQVLRGLWAAVEPYWRSVAAGEASQTAAQLRQQARIEPDLLKIAAANTFVHKDGYRPQIMRARSRGELHVVPMSLGNEGAFYWAFPDAVLIGVGSGTPQKQARKRERMEAAANRFKVLSDPTRLAILAEVMHGSHYNATTVTELASLFGLSQPTISVHMKILREAGLVSMERDGNRTLYRADEGRIRDFVTQGFEDFAGKSTDPLDC